MGRMWQLLGPCSPSHDPPESAEMVDAKSLDWLLASLVCQFTPKSYSFCVSNMDPLTNSNQRWVPCPIVPISKTGPQMGARPLSQNIHRMHSGMVRCSHRSTSNVMAGRLHMRWATKGPLLVTVETFQGRAEAGPVVWSPWVAVDIAGPRLLLPPLLHVNEGHLVVFQ